MKEVAGGVVAGKPAGKSGALTASILSARVMCHLQKSKAKRSGTALDSPSTALVAYLVDVGHVSEGLPSLIDLEAKAQAWRGVYDAS